ncbi:hypothetical protein ACHAWF_006002 [Thalassiosira exigua]
MTQVQAVKVKRLKRKRAKRSEDRRRGEQLERIVATGFCAAGSLVGILYCLGFISVSVSRDGEGGRRLGQPLGLPSIGKGTGFKEGKEIKAKRRHQRKGQWMRRALENPESDPEATAEAREILSASVHLVSIDFDEGYVLAEDHYGGVVGRFCALDFAAHKAAPSEIPMFHDLEAHSGCQDPANLIHVDLKEAAELVREFDDDNAGNLPTALDLRGAVFHESRCGSTLAANALVALEPTKHRVYVESAPPAVALRACGEDFSKCSANGAANLLRDVIYMMGRSDDPDEESVFFKFQSITTRTMEVFTTAFPTTPWIFLYREPVDVLMSQLNVPKTKMANCVRSKNRSPAIRDFVDRGGWRIEDLDDEEVCAVHLATLCESALRNLDESDGLGMAVNYSPDLGRRFLDRIFPEHFRLEVEEAGRDRVLKVSGTYSKNRGRHGQGEFQPDSEKKEKNASRRVKDAARHFLQPTFEQLQDSEYNVV